MSSARHELHRAEVFPAAVRRGCCSQTGTPTHGAARADLLRHTTCRRGALELRGCFAHRTPGGQHARSASSRARLPGLASLALLRWRSFAGPVAMSDSFLAMRATIKASSLEMS